MSRPTCRQPSSCVEGLDSLATSSSKLVSWLTKYDFATIQYTDYFVSRSAVVLNLKKL